MIAAVLRVWAALDEFWLDEIWSLVAFARVAQSPLDIFTFHHDNNHYLTTLWMYLVGPSQTMWFVYRVPSLVAGMGTVMLALVVARRWGPAAMISATLLTSTSFFLITYASEARGYALAGFFALAAFLALDRFLSAPSRWAAAAFGICSLLGILSHLIFVQFMFAALVWSPFAMRNSNGRWRNRAAQVALLHAVPLAGLAVLYVLDIRDMRIGGGSVHALTDVVPRSAALALGCFTQQASLTWVVALAALVAIVSGLILLTRARCSLWIFFATMILAAPAALLIATRPTLVYERYFYLNVLFTLLLFSYLVGRTTHSGGVVRVAGFGALAVVTLGNAWAMHDFLHFGRGHYLEMLRYVNRHATQLDVQLISDGDFDNQVYLSYYVPLLPPGRIVSFFKQESPPAVAPEWLVLHDQTQPYEPPATIRGPHGVEYVRARVFPYAGLSGYNFGLYQRADARGRR